MAVETGAPALSTYLDFWFHRDTKAVVDMVMGVIGKEEEVRDDVGGQSFLLNNVLVGSLLLGNTLSPTTPGTIT